MGLSKRIRNIAKTQIKALQDRLDRIDTEAEIEAAALRARRDAMTELEDPADQRLTRRTPEEIAAGIVRAAPPAAASSAAARPTAAPVGQTTAPAGQKAAPAGQAATNPLSKHYRVLGVEEGADFNTVEAAYRTLAARCAPERFPEGSEEQAAANEIFRRVDDAFNALRDALDPTAGRFDKLEL